MRRELLGRKIIIATFGNAAQNAKEENITSIPYEFETKCVEQSWP